MNKVSIPLLMLSTLALLSACGGGGSSSQTTPNPTAVPTAEPTPTLEPTPTPEPSPEPTATPTPEPGPTSEPMLVEAESGSLTGLTVANSQSGYSGSGYVTGFADGDERLAVSFTLAESGSYSIVIGYRTIGGQKGFDYTLDAASGSAMFADSATFSEYPLGTFSLDAGEHSFTLGGGWNWYEIDYIAISAASTDRCITEGQTYPLCETDTGSWGVENGELCLSASFCPGMRSSQSAMAEDLQNPNADATAQGVYDYLRSVWGSKTLSGQQDLTWKDSTDMYQRVFNDTGEYPALMGYDFMNYTPNSGGSGLQQTEEAIAHWARGGLVTFAWHWRSPLVDDNAAFYTSQSDLEIPVNNYLLDTSGSVFEDLAQQIDIVAEQLQVLENNGVTVIFRPLHEAAGGWFWWGRSRSDDVPPAYAQVLLWQYLYNDLVNTRGLNNLIWMWNGQSALWYPGDDYVDIVSYDLYDNNNPQNYSARADTFAQTAGFPLQEKMVAASENGSIPHPDAMAANNAQWLFFMTWNDGDSAEGVTDSNNFWTGEYYNTNAHKQQVYSHENIVNLEDLPGSW